MGTFSSENMKISIAKKEKKLDLIDRTAKEGLRPFSIITSSYIADLLFFSFLKKARFYTTKIFSFLERTMKKTENKFSK